jgi:bacterioferritin (cytochrome b1)
MTVDDFLNEVKSTCETRRHPAMLGDLARSVERWGKRAARAVRRDRRPEILDVLMRQYAEEIESIIRLKHHAENVRYPQFARELLEIARQEQRHAQSLVGRICALGGKVPKVALGGESGAANWEALGVDRERETRCCDDLVEALALTKDIDDESAELLGAILRDERKHLQAITEMQMRSDPQS